MTDILWKIIRFITANLGIILIGLGVTAVCFAFIMDGAIDHLPDIDESAKSSAERYIDENRDVIREEVMQYIEQEQDVDLDTMINEMDVEQMKIVCTVDPKSLDGVSLDFCRDIEGKSEKEIKDMLLEKQIDLGINQIVTQTSNISDSIEYGIKEKFNVTLDEVSDKYVSAFKWIGVFMIIVGSAFIFVSRKFAVYPSLYSIAVNLTINVGMCSAMLWFIRNVSPGTMVDTIQKMSANNSEFSPILELPKSLVEMVITIIIDWFAGIVNPLVNMFLIFTFIFLAATVGLYILKKKDEKRQKRYSEMEKKLKVIKSETDTAASISGFSNSGRGTEL